MPRERPQPELVEIEPPNRRRALSHIGGRVEASEYRDKINTVWDSAVRRRSDGAMIRVMTSVAGDEPRATAAAIDLSARLADNLGEFVPE